MLANVMLIAILALALGGAIRYIYKAKKSGRTCIGCPDGCSCSGHGCGCGGHSH